METEIVPRKKLGFAEFCAVCGEAQPFSKQIPYPYRNGKTNAHQPDWISFCQKCGLGIATPKVSEEYLNEYYSIQPSAWGDFSQWTGPVDFPVHYVLGKARWKNIKSFLPSGCKKLRVLDIGAGNAALGFAMLDEPALVSEYIAFDLDKRVLNRVGQLWPEKSEIKFTIASSLDEIRDSVDVVVFSHIIEHVQDPLGYMGQVLKYLKLGGLVFGEVPNSDFRFKPDTFPHVLFFTAENFGKLFSRLGLSKLDCSVWGSELSSHPIKVDPKSLKGLSERAVLKLRSVLPESIYFRYFDWLYGASRRSDGPWIRYVGLKK